MRCRFAILFVSAGLVGACGAEEATRPVPAATGTTPQTGRFEGMYEVSGLTTDVESGDTRRIAGTVIIAADGGAYSATFNMTTEFPGPDGAIKADLIGTGAGKTQGGTLVGTADTQMFLAAIPGVDPKFPWIPGRLGPRIASTFTMVPADRDGFEIAIETRGVPGPEGQNYGRTRTALRAGRTSPRLGSDGER